MLNQEKKVPLSLLIPCKNEESNIERCIKSVEWIEEKFVIDSQSTDRTIEIAEHAWSKVVQFDYKGGWPKKKNWALENLPFSHEWVLIMDADECLPPEAEEEIRKIITDQMKSIPVIGSTEGTSFLGKPLKHAYFPNWNLRLFKHKQGRYEKITDLSTDSGDHEIHEHVVVKGTTGKLKSIMDHHAFPTIDSFVEKHNRYSNWEAVVENSSKDDESALQHDGVKGKRDYEGFSVNCPSAPPFGFSMFIFGKEAFLMDGRLCVCSAYMPSTNFLSQAKIQGNFKDPKISG